MHQYEYNTVTPFARATIYIMGRPLKSGGNSSMLESFSGSAVLRREQCDVMFENQKLQNLGITDML
jgi:hypothetical protein